MKEDFIRQQIMVALLDSFKKIREGNIDKAWEVYDNFYDKLSQFIDEDVFNEEKRKIIF